MTPEALLTLQPWELRVLDQDRVRSGEGEVLPPTPQSMAFLGMGKMETFKVADFLGLPLVSFPDLQVGHPNW